MNALNTLFLCAILVVGLSLASVLALRGALGPLLVELCRSENHGRFWLAFASLSIVLTSLFCALIALPTHRLAPWHEESWLEIVVSCFRTGLLGLLLALAGVALVLLVSIAQLGIDVRQRSVPNS